MKKVRQIVNHKGINQIFLVGEVVDTQIETRRDGKNYGVRTRLKIRGGRKTSNFVYVDMYGRQACRETMALICQTGNIVYVEGEFRNKTSEVTAYYILVTRITCLLRRKDVKPPSENIIDVLDSLDPLGYEKKRVR